MPKSYRSYLSAMLMQVDDVPVRQEAVPVRQEAVPVHQEAIPLSTQQDDAMVGALLCSLLPTAVHAHLDKHRISSPSQGKLHTAAHMKAE